MVWIEFHIRSLNLSKFSRNDISQAIKNAGRFTRDVNQLTGDEDMETITKIDICNQKSECGELDVN